NRLRRHDPRRHAAQQRAARMSVKIHLAAYVAGSLLMLGIWLAVGFGGGGWYFWPVWPIMGWGIGVASHAIPIWAHGSMSPARIA
ncbi:2TM domain-containing protein, partial [Streptomyces lonegramiae]